MTAGRSEMARNDDRKESDRRGQVQDPCITSPGIFTNMAKTDLADQYAAKGRMASSVTPDCVIASGCRRGASNKN